MAFNDSTLSLATFGGSKETKNLWLYATAPNAFQDPLNDPEGNREFTADHQITSTTGNTSVLDKDYFGNETKIQTGDLMYIDAPVATASTGNVVQRYYRCLRTTSGYITLQGTATGTASADIAIGVGKTGIAGTA